MKRRISKKIIFLAFFVLAVCGFGIYWFWPDQEVIEYKTSKVKKQDVSLLVDATGTVEPEELIDVGARVSGQIVSFGKDKDGNEVDYGSTVVEGDVIAMIDDVIPQSAYLQSKAKLEQAKASKTQAEANLKLAKTNLLQAERNWNRAQKLGVTEALSQAQFDVYLSEWEKAMAQIGVAEAQIEVATASVEQAEASIKEALRNLDYCIIKAPVTGVVIDRKVNVGQTVVSNMSASSLFLLAKDLKKMEVWASVNEADIGKIFEGQKVTFKVNAFPQDFFVGKVGKIRLNATMTQNVVTYIVEVITDNSDLKLLPYLTANLKFEVEKDENVLTVLNSALEWSPPDLNRPEVKRYETENGSEYDVVNSVWVLDADRTVRQVPVEIRISDGIYTSVNSSLLKEGDKVISGIKSISGGNNSSSNPFIMKMPTRSRTGGSSRR